MARKKYRIVIEYWDNKKGRWALTMVPGGQRDVDMVMVRMFYNLWASGRWDPSIGAPMCWLDNGTFGNGAHRATFIAGLPDGVEVPVLVAYDVPVAMLAYMDGGKNRTLGHHLHYAFPDSSASLCRVAASIVPIVMSYDGPKSLPRLDVKPDPLMAVEWAVSHQDRLLRAATEARRIVNLGASGGGSIMTERTLGFVLYLLQDEIDAVAFFESLATGASLDLNDPRLVMSQFYERPENKLPRGAQSRQVTMRRIADLLGCWDAYQRKIKWRRWNGEASTFRHPVVEHLSMTA